MAEDEAWTTNRHIYLMEHIPSSSKNKDEKAVAAAEEEDFEELLGECITKDNLGYDTNPVFSPDGKRLAWLTMKSPTYESDAVGILVYDLETKKTSTLLEAERDWDYSPNSLRWSKDGETLFFTADIRSKQALCSINSTIGARRKQNGDDGGGIRILKDNQSSFLHGEVAGSSANGGHLLLATVQSLSMPTELFLVDSSFDSENKTQNQLRQLTHFNTQRMIETKLGKAEEFIYQGDKGDDVQSWLIRPAGFTHEQDSNSKQPPSTSKQTQHPLVVIYHGGPQGSSGDDWHFRWNLQYWASMGFAVFAPNFHGSTGFGHQFCRDITENWEVGGRDTMHGVRAVLKEYPWIDPQKVVGLGGSYGGYTSNWLNGNAPDDMFQALVCHCGTFDMRSSYYATDGKLFFFFFPIVAECHIVVLIKFVSRNNNIVYPQMIWASLSCLNLLSFCVFFVTPHFFIPGFYRLYCTPFHFDLSSCPPPYAKNFFSRKPSVAVLRIRSTIRHLRRVPGPHSRRRQTYTNGRHPR